MEMHNYDMEGVRGTMGAIIYEERCKIIVEKLDAKLPILWPFIISTTGTYDIIVIVKDVFVNVYKDKYMIKYGQSMTMLYDDSMFDNMLHAIVGIMAMDPAFETAVSRKTLKSLEEKIDEYYKSTSNQSVSSATVLKEELEEQPQC